MKKSFILASSLVLSLSLSATQAAGGRKPAKAAVGSIYYLHGVAQDQANKQTSSVNGTPPPAGSLTFSNSNTFGGQVMQSTGNPNPDFVPNELANWWVGS